MGKPQYIGGLRVAAGGVVIRDDGMVLVREPANHFDGFVWSLPKGGVDAGETLEEGALREVEEETGVRAEIVAPIPGEWLGSTSVNRYFLMQFVAKVAEPDDETWAIAFVPYEEAQSLLSQSTNAKGRKRDLEVLAAGYALYLKMRQPPRPPHVFANRRRRFA